MSKMLQLAAAVAATVALSTAAHAVPVDVNGGTSWGGWTNVGNSLSNGIWGSGPGNLGFDIYTTRFTNSAANVNLNLVGSRGTDNLNSLTTGNNILGIGFAFTNPVAGLGPEPGASAATAFFKFDFGAIGYAAASFFGATDGQTSGGTFAGAGDFNIQVNGIQGVGQPQDGAPNVLSVYTGVGGAFNQTGLNATSPIVGLMRNGIGYQLLIDEDAFEALYTTAADFASAFRVVIAASGPLTIDPVTQAVISFPARTGQVPVPGTLVLVGAGLAGLGLVARRRRA